ncbi:hypothetical protein TNCV_1994401 [Trichonephila clavipes]|nr:hypothetical protein TNCV_1994401 [Trichonephila clavipes]
MDLNHATINRSNTGQRRPKTGGDWKVIPDGITKPTVVYTEKLIHGTDSNQGKSWTSHQSHMVRFSGRQQFNSQPRQFLYNRIDLIFTRPEMKITRGKDDN